jgi:hypothetical protein
VKAKKLKWKIRFQMQ